MTKKYFRKAFTSLAVFCLFHILGGINLFAYVADEDYDKNNFQIENDDNYYTFSNQDLSKIYPADHPITSLQELGKAIKSGNVEVGKKYISPTITGYIFQDYVDNYTFNSNQVQMSCMDQGKISKLCILAESMKLQIMIKTNIDITISSLQFAATYNNLYIYSISYKKINNNEIIVTVIFDNKEKKSRLVFRMVKANNIWQITELEDPKINKDFFDLIDICQGRSYKVCLPVIIKRVYGSNAKVDM